MATKTTLQNKDIRSTFSRPAVAVPADVEIVSHSGIFFWWPAWVAGYAMALFSYLQGQDIAVAPAIIERMHSSNNPGIFFIAVIVLLVVLTNTKLRGVYSVMTVVTVCFVIVVLALLGWWDSILTFVPQMAARANIGFYLLFSSSLLIVWLLAFFLFDRLVVWRVRPGQMVEEQLVGGQARSYDTNGLIFERLSQGLFHDVILGLGSGDLVLTIDGANQETIRIPNVLFVNSKVAAIQRLIAVKPEVVQPAQD